MALVPGGNLQESLLHRHEHTCEMLNLQQLLRPFGFRISLSASGLYSMIQDSHSSQDRGSKAISRSVHLRELHAVER